MNTPQWAQELTINACIHLQETGKATEDYSIKWNLPAIHWKSRRPARNSSGTCYPTRIIVRAGTDRLDAKLVLLHEIAHWVCPGEHHTDKFWDTAWELYRWAKLPVRYCLKREKTYRKGALVAYHRSVKQ